MAETYAGEVRNGVVVFDGAPPPLPEATKVLVEAIGPKQSLQGLSDKLLALAGTAEGLSSDPSERLAHGWQGRPERRETPAER